MSTDVNRFFREAKPIGSAPTEWWMFPGKFPAPYQEIQGDDREATKKKLVNMANSLLVTANHRAGDYAQVYFSFKPLRGLRKDLRTGRMVSRAVVSLLVHERN